MADATPAAESQTEVAKPAKREVKIDIRSVVLAAILNAGEYGITLLRNPGQNSDQKKQEAKT